MHRFDDLDMKLLYELTQDGSISVPTLSKKLGINASVLYSRIKRLMKKKLIKKFTVENGLIDNILYRIEEDNANNLGISSYSGLVKFNKKTYSTKIYRTKDGLVNTEFNRISSFKNSYGEA